MRSPVVCEQYQYQFETILQFQVHEQGTLGGPMKRTKEPLHILVWKLLVSLLF